MWPNGHVSPLRGAKMFKEKGVRNVSNRARKTRKIEISCQDTLLHRCEVNSATEILECGPQNLKKRPNKDVKKEARVGSSDARLAHMPSTARRAKLPQIQKRGQPVGPPGGLTRVYITLSFMVHIQ